MYNKKGGANACIPFTSPLILTKAVIHILREKVNWVTGIYPAENKQAVYFCTKYPETENRTPDLPYRLRTLAHHNSCRPAVPVSAPPQIIPENAESYILPQTSAATRTIPLSRHTRAAVPGLDVPLMSPRTAFIMPPREKTFVWIIFLIPPRTAALYTGIKPLPGYGLLLLNPAQTAVYSPVPSV